MYVLEWNNSTSYYRYIQCSIKCMYNWITAIQSIFQFYSILQIFSVLTDCCTLAVMVLILLGSQITMSASEPTAIRPLRGYRLKILAALVLVTATNWFSSIFPIACREQIKWWLINATCTSIHINIHADVLTTALSQTKPILSSTPLVPSGIRVKLSFPMAFWEVL